MPYQLFLRQKIDSSHSSFIPILFLLIHYPKLILTRQSSCVNARGIPPAAYWVLLLLSYSYLGTPPHPPGQVTPPSRVPLLAGYHPPTWTWQGTRLPTAGPGRVWPPPVSAPWHSGKCCEALWDMGTPPVDRQMEGQTRVKTLPSRRTTYAGGKYIHLSSFFNIKMYLFSHRLRSINLKQSFFYFFSNWWRSLFHLLWMFIHPLKTAAHLFGSLI